MTNREAIEALKIDNGIEISGGADRMIEFLRGLEMAIDALEALESMNPIPIVSGYADGNPVYDFWECPCCGADFEINEKYNFCPECGQHMKRE